MALDPANNFVYGLVSVAPSPASSGTSMEVTLIGGCAFPLVEFNCTVWPAGVGPLQSNAEIVRVTNYSMAGPVATLTILRTREGTAARAIAVGDQFALTITAKLVTDISSTFQPVGNYQPLDQDLTDIANLAPSDGSMIQRNGGIWTARTIAEIVADMVAEILAQTGVPQVVLAGDVTVDITHNGKSFDHTDATPREITIDSNANDPLPIGTVFSVDNGPGAAVVTITIVDDTLILASDGSTGDLEVAANGVATIRKTAATVWKANGTQLAPA